MLTSLRIKNFRTLENFEVAKLGRVNLIVGKNNSGKSSVLEALHIYAGNANLDLLEAIAANHDEKYRLKESDRDEQDPSVPFEDFFTGRRYPSDENNAIEIGDPNTDELLRIEHGYFVEQEESATEENGGELTRIHRKRISYKELLGVLGKLGSVGTITGQALYIQKGNRPAIRYRLDFNSSRIRTATYDTFASLPCSVIPTRLIPIDELADEWDKIGLIVDARDILKQAVNTISPDFEDIQFIRSDDFSKQHREVKRTAKARLSGVKRPVPLNSLGDGVLRVLQLVLKLFPAKGGFLLIDEFENGLHYSVQEQVWKLVFHLAEKLNIQVFATTHSWDCIESFAKASSVQVGNEGMLFRMGKSIRNSDKGRIIATEFDREQLFNITQSDVEVR